MQSKSQGFFFEGNQMLFNLEAPARTENILFTKSTKPQPVVIEKIGPNATPVRSSLKLNHSQSLQFSAVSENSLNAAVQLAKRDLRKQKEEGTKQATSSKSRPTLRTRSPVGRTKIVQSREQRERLRKRQERDKKKPMGLIEKQRARSLVEKSAQARRDRTPEANILHYNADLSNLPVTTNSPPTRDTSLNPGVTLTGDAKVMHEIKRLRTEMEKCMKQIKEIQQAAKQEGTRSTKLKYAEDIEDARKKKQRAEEQTTRSSRMIYVLNQQVKVIQADIDKMQGHTTSAAKKSQTMTKLAAAHRGAVKVLQNFVTHLPDYDLKAGMPRNYQEMGLLLRQLSLCCAQLEVTGNKDVPDSVMVLIKDMADLNKMIDKGLTGSEIPPRPSEQARSRSPSRETKMADRKKEVAFEESDMWNSSQNNAFQTEKLERGPSNERELALRRGIQSLLQAAEEAPPTPRTPRDFTPRSPSPQRRQPSPHDVPPLNLPVTPRGGNGFESARSTGRNGAGTGRTATGRTASGRGLATGSQRGTARSRASEKPVWETVMQRNKKIKKGLLLPHHLQAEREKTQRRLVDLGEAHYAAPTQSSSRKEVRLEDLPRSRDASPRRALMGSPRGSPTRGISREEISRQVWQDRERAKSEVEYLDAARRQRQTVEDVSFRLGKSPEWVAATERRIRSKIEPLIAQAEVEMNADLLSEMILKDMVNDVADDVYNMRQDNGVHNEACTMMDLPDLETIMGRLEKMEEEQLAIRHRWATVVYDDDYEDKARTTYYDAGYSDRPLSPKPIELTHHGQQGTDPIQGIIDQRINTDIGDDGVIRFTKVQQKPCVTENLQLSRRVSVSDLRDVASNSVTVTRDSDQPIYLYLTQEILNSIDENKDKYERFLKKMNFQSVGRFDPQKIVAEIADEIMADCMQEVSRELLEINNDIVESTYKSEFKDAGLPTPQQ